MRINQRWVSKPSIILATTMLLILLTQTTPCSAADQQNITLSEVSIYNFTAGYQNIVKTNQFSDGEFMIIKETPLPSLNISYIAKYDGILTVTIKSVQGPLPYLELNDGWAIHQNTYSRELECNQSTYLIFTPPLMLSDSNTSSIVGGPTYTWEIYRWPNMTGQISYDFFSSADIELDLLIYPQNPRQGEKINIVTYSNSDINNLTLVLLGENLHWINQTDLLEIQSLDCGTYTITAQGIDVFNISHIAQSSFTVSPSILNPQSYELDFFSISYPETVSQGDQVTVSATIDYSMPITAEIKCQLFDPVENIICKELIYNVSDSGSKQFVHQFIADEEGAEPLLMRLYYDIGGGWVEVNDAQETFIVTINAVTASTIPGFNLVPTICGLTLIVILLLNQKNN